MIRLNLVLLAALLVLTACSDSSAPRNKDFALTKISERVYVLPGPLDPPNKQNRGFANNPGFVITGKGVVVIDPGSSMQIGQMLLDKIRTITQAPVIAVFNTHIHGDHWLANCAIRAAYPRAVIYAHPAMISKTAAGEGEAWLSLLNRLTNGALKETRIVAPDLAVNDGDTLKLGDVHFRIYHNGKAHTDADIMIEAVEEKVMFLGDNLSFGRTPRLDDGDFRGNIAALDMALKSDAQYFIAGHGKSGGHEIPRAFSAYLTALYDAVKTYHAQGLSDFAMKPKVALELAAYKDWVGFDEGLGKLISLAYLQVEADSFK
jgi:glyoxylase-like metal-dependent hydrolase (beta-lactamase superfamily II)